MDKENVTYFIHITYKMEFYSTFKDEIISFAGKWMELEIMLSEISQFHKSKYYMFSFICGS
jgi:hypothetical protein